MTTPTHIGPRDLMGLLAVESRIQADPDPDTQTLQTVIRMADAARRGGSHPLVLAAVDQLPACMADDARACAEDIYWWVKQHVQFALDPRQDELLVEPPLLLSVENPRGDCDDFSMLVVSMLRAAGIDAEFVTVAGDGKDPSRFSHVYVRALLPDGPLVLDASHGSGPGWEAQDHGHVWRKQGCSIEGLPICQPVPVAGGMGEFSGDSFLWGLALVGAAVVFMLPGRWRF